MERHLRDQRKLQLLEKAKEKQQRGEKVVASLLIMAPVAVWLFSLGIFLTLLKREQPERYRDLSPITTLFKGKEKDAVKLLAFFFHQKHQALGGKVAPAGKVLNIVFILFVMAMLGILWLGVTGQLDT